VANKRIIYATKGMAIKKTGATIGSGILQTISSGVNSADLWEVPKGVQSVGVTTTFNLEQVFQQGQLNLYENVEDRPDVEVTVSRVLDGTHPLYLMASDDNSQAAGTARTLNQRNAQHQVDIALHIYPDTNDRADGAPESRMLASGMFLSSVSYTFPVDGSCTEEITFVGNNKFWCLPDGTAPTGVFPATSGLIAVDEYPATDLPTTITSRGVVRREDVDLSGTGSTLPLDIPGVTGAGKASTVDSKAIQNITVSADLGRDEIFALGQKDVYHRVIAFPLEVTCSIECVTSKGDLVEAEADIDNLTNRTIIIKTVQGLTIDLGTANKLSSIDFTGGDTGGGEVSVTYNYSNFNNLTIVHAHYP